MDLRLEGEGVESDGAVNMPSLLRPRGGLTNPPGMKPGKTVPNPTADVNAKRLRPSLVFTPTRVARGVRARRPPSNHVSAQELQFFLQLAHPARQRHPSSTAQHHGVFTRRNVFNFRDHREIDGGGAAGPEEKVLG